MAITLNFSTGEIGWASSVAAPPPSGGTALFVDSTGINFVDGTNMDWTT